MNNTFSIERVAKIGDLNADLLMRQYKLYKTAKFMEIKSANPKLKQSEIARELKIAYSTLQRYRRELNMLSPYRLPPSSKTHTRKQKTSNNTKQDLRMTSNDLKLTSKDLKMTSKDENDELVSRKVKTKNNSRGGDPNDDNLNKGRELLEEPFSSQ